MTRPNDEGADIIFGGHSHRLQPVEMYRGRPMFYSLANFVWPDFSVASATTAVAEVTVSPSGKFAARLIPVFIEDAGLPVLRGAVGPAARSPAASMISILHDTQEGLALVSMRMAGSPATVHPGHGGRVCPSLVFFMNVWRRTNPGPVPGPCRARCGWWPPRGTGTRSGRISAMS